MNEVRATSIFGVCEIFFFASEQIRLFQEYFLEELLLTNVLSALENSVTFSGKPDRLSPFLSVY